MALAFHAPSPDNELLSIENNRVLSALEPALHRLLELTRASVDDPNYVALIPERTTPVLTLRLFPRSDLWPMDDTKRAQALSAFSVLIEHSRRLRDYPVAKRAFWLDVLHSRMPHESTFHVPEAALCEPEFPIFVVEFRDDSQGYSHYVARPFVLPEDAVIAFVTTPPIMPTPTQIQVRPRPDIIEHCPNLRHLSLQGMNIPKRDIHALLVALRTGPLRTRLLTLNLNNNYRMSKGAAALQLAAMLTSRNNISDGRLVLQELRLNGIDLPIEVITTLNNMLLSNYDLRVLQLQHCNRWPNSDLYAQQNELREVHDEQLLQLTLPIKAKLAFVSVSSRKPLATLDANLLAMIFRFAEGCDVRRTIALMEEIERTIGI